MNPILWERKDTHSVEYFTLAANPDAFVLEGTVVLMVDALPTRIMYRVECDNLWRTKAVVIHQDRSGNTHDLSLQVSDEQIWRTEQEVIHFAAGLYDVDLEITPATNTLPIRRLNLQQAESREVSAVWIRFPNLTLERLQQRYTRIGDRLYQYESSTGYTAQLEVDEFGLVVHYDLWHRISTESR